MFVRLSASLLACTALVTAADIRGTITIVRKLTRYNVTASAGIYQRGLPVDLGDDPAKDPIAFELSHVAVYLEGVPDGAASRPLEATIEQKNRRFVPDLVVIPAGSTISFPNSDPVFHNVFSLSKTKSFDLGNYPKGKTQTIKFTEAGVVAVYCHLHPNMEASIVVAPNRWVTRAASDGRFALTDVPAGSYTVVAWHRITGAFRKKVDIAPGGSADIQFVLPYVEPSAAKTIAHR